MRTRLYHMLVAIIYGKPATPRATGNRKIKEGKSFLGKTGSYLARRHREIARTYYFNLFETISAENATPLVLKIVSPEKQDGYKMAVRIICNEACILKLLNQDSTISGVLPLVDFGDRDSYFIAIPKLEGLPLSEIMEEAAEARSDSHFIGFCLHVLTSVLKILDLVHAKGVLHRDIKPANIFITRNGSVYLIDFGMAVLMNGIDVFNIEEDMVVGTPLYMAPERVAACSCGPKLDGRSDLYELAATMYALITRRPFLEHPSSIETLFREKCQGGIPVPKPVGLAAPEALGELIEWMGQIKPGDRPESAWAALETIKLDREEGYLPKALTSEEIAEFMARVLFSVHGGCELDDQ